MSGLTIHATDKSAEKGHVKRTVRLNDCWVTYTGPIDKGNKPPEETTLKY